MIEFAIVVILLITLLYGIIAFGLILSAPATVTLAAADVVRAGGVASLSAVSTAEAQATTDPPGRRRPRHGGRRVTRAFHAARVGRLGRSLGRRGEQRFGGR